MASKSVFVYTLLQRVKTNVDEAEAIILRTCDKKNTLSHASVKSNNKEELVDLLYTLGLKVLEIRKHFKDLQANMNDYNVTNQHHEELAEKMLQKMHDDEEKLAEKMLQKMHDEFTKLLPQPIETQVPKKNVVCNEKQVLVINNLQQEDIVDGKLFSSALKENLSVQLKEIPVSKATVNREGKGILIFPSPESCTQAKASLSTNYHVHNSNRKQNVLLPRLKIHNLDPELLGQNKEELRNKMLSKNESLKNATEDDFKITFIDKKQSFAIARVNPEIHKKITNAGRVYIDLWSNKVSNHYQPLQCFKCQAFNHTSTSPLCPLHEKPNETTCLYCAKNHPSATCPAKKNKKSHRCSNCLKNDNPSIKKEANSHTSTSKLCPTYIKEVERLKINTCYDHQMFLDSKNQQNPM